MPMSSMPANRPQTCHDSPWPCHDTVPQQVLGHQPSQARAVGQQTKECHDTRWPPPAATTSGGAPPPLPVLGGEWKRKVLEARRSTTTHGGASGGGRWQNPDIHRGILGIRFLSC
ncbi:hypothetical protein CJ030_MR5G018198 [Morella rubra]|uniref:Uncharacterized protein n=1 Tax=Morella rubra TaxID=262757 RepID=A0A6A1VH08_9ROSI|nr:hypothetical protein CJ030_MR5G018198 [Morella rubra]